MSTTTFSYPNVVRVQRIPVIKMILILTSLALLTGAVLGIVYSTTRDSYSVDNVSVQQNSVVPIPVPTAPTAVIQPIPSETPAPSSTVANDPNIVAVPVPIPPSP